LNPTDYVIIFLSLVSALIGVWRGFTLEALSLIVLLAAIWLAWAFSGLVEPMLGEWAGAPEVRIWAARVVIFLVVLVVGGLVSWLARKLIRHSGLTGLDRLLGAVFGLARAVLLVGLSVILIEFFGLKDDPWWRDARLRPYAERAAAAVKYYAELGSRYLEESPVA
jgi:membrane protein required for colicin V production